MERWSSRRQSRQRLSVANTASARCRFNAGGSAEVVMKRGLAFAAVVAFVTMTACAGAQIAVSGNDGKQVRAGDDPPGMRPDSVAVIDLNHYPPKILGSVNAPASMIGPPDAVAVAADSSYA